MFNTFNLKYAVLPKCLENGENPSPIQNGLFAVFQGPSLLATVTNTLTGYTEGKGYVSGEILNNSTSYQLTNDTITYTNTSKHTFEYWIKWDGLNTTQYLMGSYEDANNYHYLKIVNGVPSFNITVAGVGVVIDAIFAITPSVYDAISINKNGSTIQMFVNGIEVNYSTQDTYALGSKTFPPTIVSNYRPVAGGSTSSFGGYLEYDNSISVDALLFAYELDRDLDGLYGYIDVDDTLILSVDPQVGYYTVTITNSGNGSTDPSGIQVMTSADSLDISAVSADEDFHFTNWTQSGAGVTIADINSAITTINNVSADTTVSANFAPDSSGGINLTATLDGEVVTIVGITKNSRQNYIIYVDSSNNLKYKIKADNDIASSVTIN